MQKIWGNPELPLEQLIPPKDFAASCEILLHASFIDHENMGFRAGAYFREHDTVTPIDEAIKRWQNEPPQYRKE